MLTIHEDSSDKTMKNFDIINIRSCHDVTERLSGLVETERDNKRVSSREFMGGRNDCEEDYNLDDSQM